MDRFKPGDVCWILYGGQRGNQCTIIDPRKYLWWKLGTSAPIKTLCYRVTVRGLGETTAGFGFGFPENWLAPVNDDGWKESTWDECLWKPKVTEEVEP